MVFPKLILSEFSIDAPIRNRNGGELDAATILTLSLGETKNINSSWGTIHNTLSKKSNVDWKLQLMRTLAERSTR